MKFLDKVEVIKDCKEYNNKNIFKGMKGTIIDAEIRDDCFNIVFVDENAKKMLENNEFKNIKDDIICAIKIEDLQLIQNNNCSDEKILEALPLNNPKWWCKVENGYIINLFGERKNRKPFDYKS